MKNLIKYLVLLFLGVSPTLGMADNQAVPNIFATQSGNVAASQLDTNFATVLDAGVNRITAFGTANTYTATSSPAITSYIANQPFVITFPASNTGASTINFNGVGSTYLDKVTAAGEVTLAANDIVSGIPYLILSDGTGYVVANPSSSNIATVIPPQGRLTLGASNTAAPVLTTDETAETAIYYVPYTGVIAPIYNGSAFANTTFTPLTLTLNTTNMPASQVYDVYLSLQSSTPTLCAMYWGGNSARSSSLGGKSGSANATVTQINGIWVNNANIATSNCYNNTTAYAISQYQGTLLGTFYTTANGQTEVVINPSAASGGSNNIIGIWNAYNRVRAIANGSDSTSTWTYATATIRSANNSTSNRISWVDGLQQTYIEARYQVFGANAAGGAGATVGIGLNSTTAFTGNAFTSSGTANVLNYGTMTGYPQLGFNYVQALEEATNGGDTETFNGNKQYMMYTLSTEY